MTAHRTIVHIYVELLSFNREYQRTIDPARVRKLVAEFNPQGLGSLTISLRPDGTRVVIDGQHRVMAARHAGYNEKVPCVQYEGLTLAEEASLFLLLNNSKQVQAIDRFRARVIAGEQGANTINDAIQMHGWLVAQGNSEGYFGAVAALERVYNGSGVTEGPREDLVHRVLEVLTKAWGHDTRAAHNLIVSGLGLVHARFGLSVDNGKLATEFSKMSPPTLLGKARTLQDARGGTVVTAMAEVITNLHNKGRRAENRLPDWRWTR